MRVFSGIPLRDVKVTGGFWGAYQELVRNTVIPYQEKIMADEIPGAEKSHVFENFRIAAGESEGDFYGWVFQDSDLAKWLEAVSYTLSAHPDPALEKRADEIIALIGRAQEPDGYLDTYFTIHQNLEKFSNLREAHELYCAGHMMEAGVAYYEATGKDSLLRIVQKLADMLYDRFISQKTKGYPGHQEIELALVKLYRVTGEGKYLELSKRFIDERGKAPNYFDKESTDFIVWGKPNGDYRYNQAHVPVREQREAVGHAVRAVYMYSAMADLAAEAGDESLYEACLGLWDSITKRKLYITGAIGATVDGEAFSIDYDLPNDTVYGETCASIGLVFFARRMLEICPSGKFADVIELALYNSVISGMSLSGTNFFYCNPLEVTPGVSGSLYGYRHVLPERPPWYSCACCPPNTARLISSIGSYAWGAGGGTVYSNLFINGSVKVQNTEIFLDTNYPWDGEIRYTFTGERSEFCFAFRIPEWAEAAEISLNGEIVDLSANLRDGYCYIKRVWSANDCLVLAFGMPARRVYAHTSIRENVRKTAVMRGPLVYCAEGTDNGGELQNIILPRVAEIITGIYDKDLLGGIVPLQASCIRLLSGDALYSGVPPREEEATLTLIPYYAWGNRGLNQMRVWFGE